ncbi:hypothetical protein SynBIOSE41_03909 [Synechococcus sp. BIOS-E4-1]|nr:hypothetical protein SynBIOSE41_03909 [Synechococcus sp. BIOS-E4-1]
MTSFYCILLVSATHKPAAETGFAGKNVCLYRPICAKSFFV